MKLAYRAVDPAGRVVDDVIEASDAHEAVELLRRDGLFVSSVSETRESGEPGDRPMLRRASAGQRLKQVAVFTRQLSVLLSTGTPLVQAIASLEHQSRSASWQAVVSDVRRRLEEGDTFAVALLAHPLYFDAIYRSLIEAGETGGRLDDMLRRLAILTRQRIHVRSTIKGALMYPIILVVIAIGVLGVMLGFVLPRFTDMFDTLGASLPPSTKALLAINEAFAAYWWLIVPGLVGAVVGLVALLKSAPGKDFFDRHVVRLPTFGSLARSFATARFTRLLGTLLESRVPLLDALRLTREGCTNGCYADLMSRAEDAVTHGDNMSTIFAKSDLVDASITEALRCGEKNGQVGPVLVNIAEFMEEENEIMLKGLSSIIEPFILVVLGFLVGLVAISMFMPLFDLTAAVPGGGG